MSDKKPPRRSLKPLFLGCASLGALAVGGYFALRYARGNASNDVFSPTNFKPAGAPLISNPSSRNAHDDSLRPDQRFLTVTKISVGPQNKFVVDAINHKGDKESLEFDTHYSGVILNLQKGKTYEFRGGTLSIKFTPIEAGPFHEKISLPKVLKKNRRRNRK